MKRQETIEELLQCLDEAISKREKALKKINNQYEIKNGYILGSKYNEYKSLKNNIINHYNEEILDYQRKLDSLCKKIRNKQPVLIELEDNNINKKGRFPRRIAFGKYRVQYENLDFYVPKMFKFPFEKPIYIYNEKQIFLINKMLLRLLYALPINKQEYYLFDPVGLGKNFWKFNSLFNHEILFPQKKVMSTSSDLKEVLKNQKKYIEKLYSNLFNIETDCYDWDTYNKKLYSQNNYKKMLPYKIFIFTSVPNEMDNECFQIFKSLLFHSKKCGFLVLFTFNQILLQAEDTKMKSIELELKKCIDNSIPLYAESDKENNDMKLYKLKITDVEEKFPNDILLMGMLKSINNEIDKSFKSRLSFNELLDDKYIFTEKSCNGLSIPIGYGAYSSEEVKLDIGDRVPHYLIGGTTGSGKSNFLHNLIMSACWRYSPDELRIYLLDFKEGVEFSKYSKPLLPHAKLVATEADTEYGITVLRHIVKEQSTRFEKFKQAACRDFKRYREINVEEKMPRILVIIDEFQVLFGNKQKDNTIETLTMIAKQGRACGVHLILSTQSLKGIDFGNIATQFSGRIALKCSAEDSRQLLGGITSNNDQASELEIPYAILNTSQGSVSGNNKFAVAEAKDEEIMKKIKDIQLECMHKNIETNPNIFYGQRFPKFPQDNEFLFKDKLVITLGKVINYDETIFRIELKNSMENNILFCGHNDMMKKSFVKSVLKSINGCDLCEEVVYIGQNNFLFKSNYSTNKRYIIYRNTKEFIEDYKDNYFETKKLLILDNCNLSKEIGFSPLSYATRNELAESFKVFIDESNNVGTHIIAFYDGANIIKRSGLRKEDFRHIVGFELNGDETNTILGTMGRSSIEYYKNRAFYADNLELQTWFRPFM